MSDGSEHTCTQSEFAVKRREFPRRECPRASRARSSRTPLVKQSHMTRPTGTSYLPHDEPPFTKLIEETQLGSVIARYEQDGLFFCYCTLPEPSAQDGVQRRSSPDGLSLRELRLWLRSHAEFRVHRDRFSRDRTLPGMESPAEAESSLRVAGLVSGSETGREVLPGAAARLVGRRESPRAFQVPPGLGTGNRRGLPSGGLSPSPRPPRAVGRLAGRLSMTLD